jgi:hypothetical protein
MTHEHFIEALEDELRRRHVQFLYTEIRSFVELHWPAIVKDPDIGRWAREFIDSGQGTVSV